MLEVDFGEHSVLGNARSFDGFPWLRRLKVLLDMLVGRYVVEEQKLVGILPDGLAFVCLFVIILHSPRRGAQLSYHKPADHWWSWHFN